MSAPPGSGSPWGDTAQAPPGDGYRLTRDTRRGWVAGVCAGIADYQGVEPFVVRMAAVLGLIFFFVPVLVAYVVLALVLKPRPPHVYGTKEEETFWRGLATAPGQTLGSLRLRLMELDGRLGRMEGVVTSDEFELRRGFRDLENGQR